MNEEPDLAITEGERRVRRQTDFNYILKCVALFILLLLIATAIAPIFLTSKKKANKVQTVHNAKQICIVLFDFEKDYGSFPDDRTAKLAPNLSTFHGAYSNDYLGQLIAGGYISSEGIFYAYRKSSAKKPDNIISPPSNILGKGECGFAYSMVREAGITRGLNSKDKPDIPLLSSIVTDTMGSFDPKSYADIGIYLRIDGSALTGRIRRSDHKLLMAGGKTLFENGSLTVWDKLEPIIFLPEH